MTRPDKPHDPIGDLITGKWVLSITGEGRFIAYRPFGWSGPDPHEQVTAETREALVSKLHYLDRHAVNDP